MQSFLLLMVKDSEGITLEQLHMTIGTKVSEKSDATLRIMELILHAISIAIYLIMIFQKGRV